MSSMRVRAPIGGTMLRPLASSQAIAICVGSVIRCWFSARLSPEKRGR